MNVKNGTLILLFLSFHFYAFAQPSPSPNLDLKAYNMERLDIQKKGMYVLGSWGALNLIGGTIGGLSTRGKDKAFWYSNAAWNVINLGIVAGALSGIARDENKDFSFSESLRAQKNLEKTLGINAGLDVAYGYWCISNSQGKGNGPGQYLSKWQAYEGLMAHGKWASTYHPRSIPAPV